MKRIILLSAVLALVLLSGCTSRNAGPILLGGIIGYAIGQNENNHQSTQPRNVVIGPGHYVCDNYTTYNERHSCLRGHNQRIAEDNRRREQDAYRHGYGR